MLNNYAILQFTQQKCIPCLNTLRTHSMQTKGSVHLWLNCAPMKKCGKKILDFKNGVIFLFVLNTDAFIVICTIV